MVTHINTMEYTYWYTLYTIHSFTSVWTTANEKEKQTQNFCMLYVVKKKNFFNLNWKKYKNKSDEINFSTAGMEGFFHVRLLWCTETFPVSLLW